MTKRNIMISQFIKKYEMRIPSVQQQNNSSKMAFLVGDSNGSSREGGDLNQAVLQVINSV